MEYSLGYTLIVNCWIVNEKMENSKYEYDQDREYEFNLEKAPRLLTHPEDWEWKNRFVESSTQKSLII